jgi:hypothetical protein
MGRSNNLHLSKLGSVVDRDTCVYKHLGGRIIINEEKYTVFEIWFQCKFELPKVRNQSVA